ncbi:carbon storage regulator [Luteimonas sp. A482]
MLILMRRDGEAIHIGDSIRLLVSSVTNDKVRIGIDAPPSVTVLREELLSAHEGRGEKHSSKLAVE